MYVILEVQLLVEVLDTLNRLISSYIQYLSNDCGM